MLYDLNEACKDVQTARKFVKDVGNIAKEYDANYFVVTDGASGVHNSGNEAVRAARKAHEQWERSHGEDPNEDWSKGDKKKAIKEACIEILRALDNLDEATSKIKVYDKVSWHTDGGEDEAEVIEKFKIVFEFLNIKHLLNKDGKEVYRTGIDSSTSLHSGLVTDEANAFLTEYYDEVINLPPEKIKFRLRRYYSRVRTCNKDEWKEAVFDYAKCIKSKVDKIKGVTSKISDWKECSIEIKYNTNNKKTNNAVVKALNEASKEMEKKWNATFVWDDKVGNDDGYLIALDTDYGDHIMR